MCIPSIDDDFSKLRAGLVAASISRTKLALFPGGPNKAAAAAVAVVHDNSHEITSKAAHHRRAVCRPRTSSGPAGPLENAFSESFNGKFRGNCLNQHWFRGLADVRRIADD